MFCYRDMTFCWSSKCVNMECHRNRKHLPEGLDMPVAFADYEPTCEIFKEEEHDGESVSLPLQEHSPVAVPSGLLPEEKG